MHEILCWHSTDIERNKTMNCQRWYQRQRHGARGACSNYRLPPNLARCLSWSYGLINERYDTCLLWGYASTSVRCQQISRKDIYRASPISPTDKWLSLRDLIIVTCQGFRLKVGGARAIKRSHCSGNEEDKLEQLERKRYLPAEKYPYLLLRFYDTYTYYIYT